LTVTVRPAISAVAVRAPPPLLTVSVTVPLPEPPGDTFSQPVWLFVVQGQPAVVVTCTVNAPPDEGTVSVVGETSYEHEEASGADCETLIGVPATVTVPVRVELLLMPAVTVAVPDAVPLPKTESQLSAVDELQVHPC
jgi:hypothetical protein